MTEDTNNDNTNTSTSTQEAKVDPNAAKIYVGNLPFKTRNAALSELFGNAGIKVAKANVVTKRYGQSSGFGFVQIDKSEVDKAVALNGTSVEGREIKVELATSLGSPKKRPRKKTSRKPKKTDGTEEAAAADASTPAAATTASTESKGAATPTGDKKKRSKRRKQKKPATGEQKEGATSDGTPVTGEAKQPRAKRTPKQPRAPRPPKSTEPKEISETVVYVANIPFSVKDEELKEFFKDVGAVSAKIVVNFRSKGFGFVTVDTHENQLKAVETKNGAELSGRPLVVKRAYIRDEPEAGAVSADTAVDTENTSAQ